MRAASLVLVLCLVAAPAVVLPGCASDGDGSGLSRGDSLASRGIGIKVDEMRYMHGQELLARMNELSALGQDAAPHVAAGTKSDDALVRGSCHWVLGAMGDRTNIPTITKGLDDAVPSVRYQAAASLVRLGDSRGFPALVEGLSDRELPSRFKCFQALRNATGQDFGYQHDASPEERGQAVARWRDWLDGVRASAL